MSLDMMRIRKDAPDDYTAIRAITVAAFAGSDYGDNGEADLIDRLRVCSSNYLSLVACVENEIVGHALFTPVAIRASQREVCGMGLAPMSVTPDRQRNGIGIALLERGFDHLGTVDCPFVVVLGEPEYYSRFGFRSAAEYGVLHGFSGIPQEVFFIHLLSNDTLNRELGGHAYYQSEFGPQHEGV